MKIRKGVSQSADSELAAKELYDAIYQDDIAFAVFYCSPDYDLDVLGRELKRRFGDANLVGCTTAGEITPNGYLSGSLTGMSVSSEEFEVVTSCIDNLDTFGFAQGAETTREMLSSLRQAGKEPAANNTFGFMLIDGLSLCEEIMVSSFHGGLGDIPLFGGSAGDGTDFGKTFIYHGGEFREGRAVFSLIYTSLPFMVFKSEHFTATEDMLVVTAANVKYRIVHEFNAEPAADEYARLLGMSVEQLNPAVFATHPVVIRISGQNFVRSIQKVNPDNSLTFYCAIDKGVVMRIAKGGNLLDDMQQTFDKIHQKIGPPQIVISCDCILRRLEIEETGIGQDVNRLAVANNMIGFSTYGEQINGMHVNHTFTGVAISSRQTGKKNE